MGNQAVNTAPRNVYTCADGKFLALSGSMQSMFERLATSIGRSDLIDDARFCTNDARVENQDELDEILGEYFSRSTLDDNLKMADEAGVTAAPVLDMAGLMSHPYFIGREIMESVPDRRGDESLLPTPVPRLSHTPGGFSRSAPELGEHNEEILNDLPTQPGMKNRSDR
jgi:crotonobetainyl-CoA:carnitine CoA-transferase CaiB-like acyl-CoA transferase